MPGHAELVVDRIHLIGLIPEPCAAELQAHRHVDRRIADDGRVQRQLVARELAGPRLGILLDVILE